MKKNLAIILWLLSNILAAQTPELYIKRYAGLAVHEMKTHRVPASITLAQGLLETGNGTSVLAKEHNNHFGIKCHSSWEGERTYHDDDAAGECFRVYDDPSESFRDHSLFLKNNRRYAELFDYDITDYQAWSRGLKAKGYATSKTYADRLIALIQKHNLTKYDMQGVDSSFVPKIKGIGKVKLHPNRILYITAVAGQSLAQLAKKTKVSVSNLVQYNELNYSSVLEEGQRVYLQQKRKYGHKSVHTVASGETMYSIAQQYGIRLEYLYKRNNLTAGSQAAEGTVLALRTYK